MTIKNIFSLDIPFSQYGSSTYHYDLQNIKRNLELNGKHEALQLASSDEALRDYKQIIAEQYIDVLNSTIIDRLYQFGVDSPDPIVAPSYDGQSLKAILNTRYLPDVDDFNLLQVVTRGRFTVRELLAEISKTMSDGMIGGAIDKPYCKWRDEDISTLIIGFVALLGYESDVVVPVLDRWPDAVEGYESMVFYDDFFSPYVKDSDPFGLEMVADKANTWRRIARLARAKEKTKRV